MADRSIIYSLEQVRSYDTLWGWLDGLISDADYGQFLLGLTGTYFQGLQVTPNSPASLSLNIAPGFVIQQAPVDASAYGSLPADTQQVMQLGYNLVTGVTLTTGALGAGQSQYVLIEVGYKQIDTIRAGDPNGGVLPYIDINNPTQPFNGPNNSGVAQNTVRQAIADIQVVYGTPATTGSEVAPTPSPGYVPVALVDLSYGQTTITSGEILSPGSIGGGYPVAPIFNGILNPHHGGVVGQAPQIELGTSGPIPQEVRGFLPIANMIASNTVGAVASFRTYAGTPNGNVAGNAAVNGASDLLWDSVANTLWVCDTTGNASSAHWTDVSGSGSTGTVFNLIGFASSGNYTPSIGAKYILVFTIGGGGGGGVAGSSASTGTATGGAGGGGGGGGTNICLMPVASLATPIAITIGAGGGFSGTGGTTYFGPYAYAAGGGGGQAGGAHSVFPVAGGLGGQQGAYGGFGQMNFAGQGGSGGGGTTDGGAGGSSALGGGNAGGNQSGNVQGWGGGGSGGTSATYGGGGTTFGLQGVVYVLEYVGP